MNVIKVGYCVSYDWELLKKSIPRVYAHADVVCLALDKDRKSWSGNGFEFDDEAFYSFVQSIDTDKKIILYEDCFSIPDLNARQNCNRHRTMIAEKMGKGGWHIQIDSDEYFLDFKSFVQYLKSLHPNPTGDEKPLNVNVCLIPLLKQTPEGYLFVDFKSAIPENAPFATNKPEYLRARNNGHFSVLSPFFVIHETWSRNEAALWFKINNWGHASEELEEAKARQSYFELWKALDNRNYKYIHDFHPATASTWPALGYCPGETIDEFIHNFQVPEFPLSRFSLFLKNNRNIARLKSLSNRILK